MGNSNSSAPVAQQAPLQWSHSLDTPDSRNRMKKGYHPPRHYIGHGGMIPPQKVLPVLNPAKAGVRLKSTSNGKILHGGGTISGKRLLQNELDLLDSATDGGPETESLRRAIRKRHLSASSIMHMDNSNGGSDLNGGISTPNLTSLDYNGSTFNNHGSDYTRRSQRSISNGHNYYKGGESSSHSRDYDSEPDMREDMLTPSGMSSMPPMNMMGGQSITNSMDNASEDRSVSPLPNSFTLISESPAKKQIRTKKYKAPPPPNPNLVNNKQFSSQQQQQQHQQQMMQMMMHGQIPQHDSIDSHDRHNFNFNSGHSNDGKKKLTRLFKTKAQSKQLSKQQQQQEDQSMSPHLFPHHHKKMLAAESVITASHMQTQSNNNNNIKNNSNNKNSSYNSSSQWNSKNNNSAQDGILHHHNHHSNNNNNNMNIATEDSGRGSSSSSRNNNNGLVGMTSSEQVQLEKQSNSINKTSYSNNNIVESKSRVGAAPPPLLSSSSKSNEIALAAAAAAAKKKKKPFAPSVSALQASSPSSPLTNNTTAHVTTTNTSSSATTTNKSTFKTPTLAASSSSQSQSQSNNLNHHVSNSTTSGMSEQGRSSSRNNKNDTGAPSSTAAAPATTKKTFYFGMDMGNTNSSNTNNSTMAEVNPAVLSNSSLHPHDKIASSSSSTTKTTTSTSINPSNHNGTHNLNKYIMTGVKGDSATTTHITTNTKRSEELSITTITSSTRIEDPKVKRSSNNVNMSNNSSSNNINNNGRRESSEDRLNLHLNATNKNVERMTPERSESRNSQSHQQQQQQQHKNNKINANISSSNKNNNNSSSNIGQRSSSSSHSEHKQKLQHNNNNKDELSKVMQFRSSSAASSSSTAKANGSHKNDVVDSSSPAPLANYPPHSSSSSPSAQLLKAASKISNNKKHHIQRSESDSDGQGLGLVHKRQDSGSFDIDVDEVRNRNHRNRCLQENNNSNSNTSNGITGVINFTGESSSESTVSSSEVDIPLLIRPTLPTRRLDLPRFSPSAAWRLLDSPRASGRSLSSEDGFSYEDRIHRTTRAHPPHRTNPERSGDSGISGDACSPANPPELGRNSSCSLSMSNHNSSSNNNNMHNNINNMKSKLRKTQINGHISGLKNGDNLAKCWTPEQDLDESSSEFEHDGDLNLSSPILLNGSQKATLESSVTARNNNNTGGSSLPPGLQTPPKFTTRSQLFSKSGFSDVEKYNGQVNRRTKTTDLIDNQQANHHFGTESTQKQHHIIHNVHIKSPNSSMMSSKNMKRQQKYERTADPINFSHGFVPMDANWFLSRSEPSLDLVTELNLNGYDNSSNKKMKKKEKKRQAKLSVMRVPSEPLDLLDKVFPTSGNIDGGDGIEGGVVNGYLDDEELMMGVGAPTPNFRHDRGAIEPEYDYDDDDDDNNNNDTDEEDMDVTRVMGRSGGRRHRHHRQEREVRSEIGYGPSSMSFFRSSQTPQLPYDASNDETSNSLILFRRPFSHIMYLPQYDSRRQSSSSPYHYLNNRRAKSYDNLIDQQTNSQQQQHHNQRLYHHQQNQNNNITSSDHYRRSRSSSNQRQIPIEIERGDGKNVSSTFISNSNNNISYNGKSDYRKENSPFVRSQSVGNVKPRIIEHKIEQAISSDVEETNNNTSKNNKQSTVSTQKQSNEKNNQQLQHQQEQEKQRQEEISNKKKKFKFQSTLRVMERKKIEKQLTQEAEEKENQRLREIEFLRSVEEEFQRKRAHKENLELELNFNKLNGKTVTSKREMSSDWNDVHVQNGLNKGHSHLNNNNNNNDDDDDDEREMNNGHARAFLKPSGTKSNSSSNNSNSTTTNSPSVITSSTSTNNSINNNNNHNNHHHNVSSNSKLLMTQRQEPEGAASVITESVRDMRKELIHASRKRNGTQFNNGNSHNHHSNASQNGHGSHTEELSEFRQENTRQYCDYRRSPRTGSASPARFISQSSSSDIFPLSRRTPPEMRSKGQTRHRSNVQEKLSNNGSKGHKIWPEIICDIPCKPSPNTMFNFSSMSNLVDDRPSSALGGGGNTSGPSSIISENYRRDWVRSGSSNHGGHGPGRASSVASLHSALGYSDHIRLSSTDLTMDSPRANHGKKSQLYQKYSSSPAVSPVPQMSSALSSNISELTDKEGSSILTTTNGPPSGVFQLQPYKAKAYRPVKPPGLNQNHAIKLL